MLTASVMSIMLKYDLPDHQVIIDRPSLQSSERLAWSLAWLGHSIKQWIYVLVLSQMNRNFSSILIIFNWVKDEGVKVLKLSIVGSIEHHSNILSCHHSVSKSPQFGHQTNICKQYYFFSFIHISLQMYSQVKCVIIGSWSSKFHEQVAEAE